MEEGDTSEDVDEGVRIVPAAKRRGGRLRSQAAFNTPDRVPEEMGERDTSEDVDGGARTAPAAKRRGNCLRARPSRPTDPPTPVEARSLAPPETYMTAPQERRAFPLESAASIASNDAVDVGEGDFFCMEHERAIEYSFTYRSSDRVLMRALDADRSETLVRVGWSE